MAITNSKNKQLEISEVIAAALGDLYQRRMLPDGIPLYAAIAATIAEGTRPNVEVTQLGNTVFFAYYSEDRKEVYIKALNVDTARNYLENSIQYTKQLNESGVERLVSDTYDKSIEQLFDAIGRTPMAKNWGMKVMESDNNPRVKRMFVVMKD
jgi:hypothetical protein